MECAERGRLGPGLVLSIEGQRRPGRLNDIPQRTDVELRGLPSRPPQQADALRRCAAGDVLAVSPFELVSLRARADWPITGATIFFLVVVLYYLRLDWSVALLQAPVNLVLLALADRAALLPFQTSLLIFLATFVGGWIFQLVGHAIEGRRPALADNVMQIFNAPLFLTVEVLFLFGLRQDLQETRTEPA